MSELHEQKIDKVKFVKVARFTTRKSVAENIPLPIFMVQLDASSQTHELQKINRLAHHVIKWEKLKSKDIIQCKKCQRIGHVATNCNMRFRCVKCSEQHDPGNCSLPTKTNNDRSKVYCVNCKNFGHPASYRGCPVLIELKRKATEKKSRYKKREKEG